jgi:signal transduction histidine kinase
MSADGQRRLLRQALGLALGGLLAAALVLGIGRALVVWQLGDDAIVLRSLEDDARSEFARDGDRLQRVARVLALNMEIVAGLERRQETPRRLFAAVDRTAATSLNAPALTVFDTSGEAVAWTGRPSELPPTRIAGSSALFVAQGALGLRLIAIEPVMGRADTPGRRVGTVAAEQLLSPADGSTGSDAFVVRTWLGPVTLRRTFADRASAEPPHQFVLKAPSGEVLLEASVPRVAPEQARARWRRRATSASLALCGLTALALAMLLAQRRRPGTASRSIARTTLVVIGLLALARTLFWYATPPDVTNDDSVRSSLLYASHMLPRLHRSPLDLLFTGLALFAVMLVLVDPLRAFVNARRGRRRPFPSMAGETVRALASQLVAGVAVLALEVGVLACVDDTAQNASINLLRLTILPWETPRLALLVGLMLLQASALWAAIAICRLALSAWRPDVRSTSRWLIPLAWVAPSLVAAVGPAAGFGLPALPLVLASAAVASVAWITRRGVPWYRHGSQASRLGWRVVALLVPAWFLYPALVHTVDRAKRQLVAGSYSKEVRNHPRELQSHLEQSLTQIDADAGLTDLVRDLGAARVRASTEAAFSLWRQTELEEFRLTSAIELYAADGSLVSRFALNFPETEPVPLNYQSRTCAWEAFGEAQPFGADERSMLHAEKALCTTTDGRTVMAGAVVVHVMLDYSALKFISSQSPYFEFIRGPRAGSREGAAGSDVELAIFGWGRLLLYGSSSRLWRLTDDVFERAFRSREPFWTTLERGDDLDHVYISNDRNGIYVLGYPVISSFNHFVHLGELTSLAVLTFIGLMLGEMLSRTLLRGGPIPAQLLVREIRASFYRKLFIAFVAATVIPVLMLALLVRAYFANQLRNDVESEAARTALTARRVIEESLAVQKRDQTASSAGLSDDVMVWISRVINQDVNIFDGSRLLVTSERDLFESGLLPTRTPDAVYQAVAIERLPTYVGQDRIGDLPYLVAATPVRIANREAILTVPLASRYREIEHEIEELDRGVHLGALVLILLGSAVGYWMAERIGDPVQRLTRATRRIAAGDLSVRVIVRTADELQRLVEAFNRMAGELQRQRQQLERTNRLEAWAEMARQVAHDIKNPLTPIQLSAEHLRRVHKDRGEPLGPVLDNCVDSILTQVRLLRQIASEFSSFGSSPKARPAPTGLGDLVREVVEPYRAGMDGRVRIDVAIDPDLPTVSVDRLLVARAVTNIIENALHAMPSGGTLSVSARAESGGVVMELTDTGVGMDDEAQTRIFEPYFSTRAAGTGLGLSIARRNIELNGGTIVVTSRKGVGTTVTIRLPA